jgi:hypothetical protein
MTSQATSVVSPVYTTTAVILSSASLFKQLSMDITQFNLYISYSLIYIYFIIYICQKIMEVILNI